MDGLIKKWKLLGARFELKRDEPMSRRTTFGTGGKCTYAVLPVDCDSLALIARDDVTVLGRGSNVLVSDRGLELCVFTERLDGVRLEGGLAYAECGVSIPRLARLTAEFGYTGFEPLSGVPGSVGGAIRMNAGCFGTDVSDLIESVTVASKDGVREYQKSELDFGYKHSRIPELGVVLSAKFRLKPCDPADARARINDFTCRRRAKFPSGASAGCYFKRVDGVSAGYFVEKAGLKGLRIGGAEVSEKHGAFIMNLGSATSDDVVTLAEIVKEEVRRSTGVTLEQEVLLYGEF